MGYVYGGENRDVLTGEAGKPGPKPGRRPFDPSKCGTLAGYKQHKRHSQEACEACNAANTKYLREWRAANWEPRPERTTGVYDPAVCGGHNGYERHRRNRTEPCAECRAGHAAYTADYRARRAA